MDQQAHPLATHPRELRPRSGRLRLKSRRLNQLEVIPGRLRKHRREGAEKVLVERAPVLEAKVGMAQGKGQDLEAPVIQLGRRTGQTHPSF